MGAEWTSGVQKKLRQDTQKNVQTPRGDTLLEFTVIIEPAVR